MVEMDKVFAFLEAKKRNGDNQSLSKIELLGVETSDGTKISNLSIDHDTSVEERETAAFLLASMGVSATPTTAVATEATEYENTLLSIVIVGYCDEMTLNEATEKSVGEYRANFAFFMRVVGDVPFSSLKYPQLTEFKQKLIKLPANINKIAVYRNKTIKEILQMDGVTPMSITTINKYLSRISSLFEWAMKQGYTDKNYASGLGLRNSKNAQEERHIFTLDELKALFESPKYLEYGKNNYRYWVPLIALYTGARQTEVCQLSLKDIKIENGVNFFDFNDEGNKKLKNKPSKRKVPIHSKLIELGLLTYCNQLKLDNPQQPEMEQVELKLFPEITVGRDGSGTSTSKWFARYRKQVGVNDKGKVFHSFRHTAIDHLKQKEVAQEFVAAIAGHTDESETFNRYGKKYTPEVLKPYVEMLEFDIKHPKYYPD